MIIVDTSVWVNLFRQVETPQTQWLKDNLELVLIGLTDLTLCELLQGERTLPELERMRGYFRKFPVHSTGGATLAVASAKNYLALRQRGVTIRSTIDCLIATFVIEDGHTLLHSDRDFHAFEKHLGLKVLLPL